MIEDFWSRFVAATGIDGPYEAWAFGHPEDPELATELGLLVRDGPKRATTSLVEELDEEGAPMPVAGDLSVILDGEGAPLCVIRTTSVEVRRLGDVDERFAWDEGEGDRSLAFWRAAHLDFWASHGRRVDDETAVVLERFELLWAPNLQRGTR